MISKLKPLVSAVAISAIALASQGCSRGDVHTKKFEEAGTTTLTSAELDGAAVKGLLIRADCVLHDTTGEIYTTVGRSSPCTNAEGNFTISLRKVPRYPLMLTIKARSGTTMKCDFPAGCGTTPFGSEMAVPETFALRAIAPTPSGRSISMNVTPWSDIAAARALNSTNGVLNSSVTDTAVRSASGEVAGLLNNLLGLEGQAGAFDTNFIGTTPSDLANPKTSDNNKGIMMTMLSAALIAYQDGTTDLTKVINNLADSFKSDGKFNVNDQASNIESTDTFNLANLLSKVSQVAGEISGKLTANQLSNLNTALANGTTTTTVDKFKSNVDALQTAKEAVTDANNDPTAPTPVVPITSRVVAAKRYVAEVASVFNAMDAANGSTSPVHLYNVALSASGDAVDYTARALVRAAEAASQITTLTAGDVTDLGCSGDVASTVTCDFGALTQWTEERDVGPGTVTWTASTSTITTSGINIGGVAISLEMTRTEATLSETAKQQVFTASTLTANSGSIVLNAAGATFELQQNPSSNGNWSVYSSDLYDAEASLTAASVSFAGIINIARATPDTADGGGFGLSSIYLDGDFSASGVSNISAAVSFNVDATDVAEDTLPEDETADNYYVVSDLRTTITSPVTFTKYDLTALTPDSSETSDTLVVELDGDRSAYQSGNVTSFRARLLESQMLAAGTGSFDFATNSGAKTLAMRNPNGTKIEFTADSNNAITGAITVTTDGRTTSEGSISSAGTATFSDNTSISIAAFIFSDRN